MVETSIVPEEVEQFGKLARRDWWDPDGASAMLHKLGPVRLKYIRDRIDQHWQIDECSRRPLEGKTRARRRLRRGTAGRAAGAAGREGHWRSTPRRR